MLTAGQKIRSAREELALTMRDIEIASARIAARKGNEEFAIPPSRLSDIEFKNVIPGIFRMHSLALILRRSFREVAGWYGVDLDETAFDMKLDELPDSRIASSAPGAIIDKRFRLDVKLGEGYLASAWRGWDIAANKQVLIKIFSDASSELTREYLRYIRKILQSLDGMSIRDVNLPIAVGQTDDIAYQVVPWEDVTDNLEGIIKRSVSFLPSKALEILSNIAKALSHLHNRKIVHADIKPSNILISRDEDTDVILADLGMVSIDHDGNALVLSTERYMHPDLLTSGHGQSKKLESPPTKSATYIDIYSLGVTAIEMLTGSFQIPEPINSFQLKALLLRSNGSLSACDSDVIDRLTAFLLRLLNSSADEHSITASEIAFESKSLSAVFASQESLKKPNNPKQIQRVVREIDDQSDFPISAITEVYQVLDKLDAIRNRLATQTAVFVSDEGTLKPMRNVQEDEKLITEVQAVLDKALKRTHTTWKVGVAMTVAAFIVIVGMIMCAVILGVLTGQSRWAVIFGGVSVSSVIGTLIWRPFDRIFRATVQSQQIEMVHIQLVTGLRSTVDPKERALVCKDAQISLRTIFRQTITK